MFFICTYTGTDIQQISDFYKAKENERKKMFIQRNVFKILIETSHFPGNNMHTTLCMVLMIFK